MNAPTSLPIDLPPPSTHRVAAPPRLDVFGPIHRALRRALAALLADMSSTSFDDASEASRIVQQLGGVVDLCEEHRMHEDALVPVVAQRVQRETLACVSAAHAAQPRYVAELRALGATLVGATDGHRALAGKTLYLHYTTFVAELLRHMAEEEQVVQPLLERFFTDEELSSLSSHA